MTLNPRIWIASTLAVLVLSTAACDRAGDQQPPAPTTAVTEGSGGAPATGAASLPRPVPPDLAAVDTANPDAVAEAVAVTAMLWDAAADSNEFDAVRRASSLMTPDLASHYAPVEHPVADAKWSDARQINAYSVPAVHTAQATHDAPPDTATAVYRTYDATWVWVGAGGKTITDPRTRYLYLTVSLQADGRWLVSTFDTTDI